MTALRVSTPITFIRTAEDHSSVAAAAALHVGDELVGIIACFPRCMKS